MLTTQKKIQIRSKALAKTRAFFDDRGFLETDVNICNKAAAVDAYIDLMEVKDEGFLHTSPELRMKDLLTNGSGNIYFLGHVFRKEEVGSLHNTEFTMLEYYRTHTNEEEFLQEVIEYLSLFLGTRKTEILSFGDAMKKYVKEIPEDIKRFEKDQQRHYLFSHFVEPNLGKDCFTIIKDFPAEEASLAKTEFVNGMEVAKRYEVFADGIELGNGFFELDCAKTARSRFDAANRKRVSMNKTPYPIDETFLKHLEKGLPKNTYGIALGFDRILMLAEGHSCIKNILCSS